MSRKIDALVAEHLMGLRVYQGLNEPKCYGGPKGNIPGWPVPHYSTDISAAWEVVEKMPSPQFVLTGARGGVNTIWDCRFNDSNLEPAFSAPMAICRAALILKGVEVLDDELD